MRPVLAALPITFLATVGVAQTTWQVEGDTGSDNLLAVIAQAAPGDVLQFVQGTGNFPPFVLTKGLTMVGPAPVLRQTTAASHSRIAVPPGQRARLVDLFFGGPAGQFIEVDGDVALEGCRFRSLAGQTSTPTRTVTITGGTVIAHECVLFGQPGGGGLAVQGGTVSLTRCFLAGAIATSAASGLVASSTALTVEGGIVVATDLVAIGGDAACPMGTPSPMLPPSPGIEVAGSGVLHLTDSDVTGGAGQPATSACQLPGAAALAGTVNARLARTTLTGGVGIPNGPLFVGNMQPTPALVGLALDSRWRLGQTTTATATPGTSGQLLALAGTFDRTAATLPGVVGPVFGLPGPAFVLATGAPAAGTPFVHGVTLPASPTLLYVEVWLQAAQLDGATVYASPLAGGIVQ